MLGTLSFKKKIIFPKKKKKRGEGQKKIKSKSQT